LIDEYTAFLRSTKVDDLTARAYAEQLKERPLYARVCGREVAKKKTETTRLLDSGRYDDAEAVYRQIGTDDPGDSSVSFSLLEVDRRRAAQSPAAGDRYEAGLRALIDGKTTTDPQRVRLFEQLGDRSLQRGDSTAAERAYRDAERLATRSDDVRR
jgi:predicted negative regulator of RcsB-dependent stress response